MKSSTKLLNLISLMKDDIKNQDKIQKRCDIRIKELQHRQDCLFKVLGETLVVYEQLGFKIVFTGEHEIICRTNNTDEDNNYFSFLSPAFDIIYKPKQKNHNGGQPIKMDVRTINFTPKANDAGAINFNLKTTKNNIDTHTFGNISWQINNDEKDQGYWIVNTVNANLGGVILSHEGAVNLFASLTD